MLSALGVACIGATQSTVASGLAGSIVKPTAQHDAPWTLAAGRRRMATNQSPFRARAFFSRLKDPLGSPHAGRVLYFFQAALSERSTVQARSPLAALNRVHRSRFVATRSPAPNSRSWRQRHPVNLQNRDPRPAKARCSWLDSRRSPEPLPYW